MLFFLTSATDYLGFSIALWLAFYLLARGFPSRITLRTVVVLLALATFFFSASVNLRLQINGATAIRSILLVVGLASWHDLTNKILPPEAQKKNNWLVALIYISGLTISFLLFATHEVFVGEKSNLLYVGRMNLGPVYVALGIHQAITSLAILNNFRIGAKIGVGAQNRYFFLASIFAASTVGYGIFALALTSPLPRVVQDGFILASILVLGISVARYQTLIERRTTLQDFPVSFLTVFAMTGIFAFVSWQWSSSELMVILVTAMAIQTHAIYDLAREFLERLQHRNESHFRHQMRQLEHTSRDEISLQDRLLDGLILLCQVMGTDGGFVAVREGERFIVSASHHSIRLGIALPSADLLCEEPSHPTAQTLKGIEWIVPSIEDGRQIAAIGIHPPKARNQYSADDLDLLVEAADRIGLIIFLRSHRDEADGSKPELEAGDRSDSLRAKSDELIAALVTNPDSAFVKMVEDGLRNLADIVTLGQSPLTEFLKVSEGTQLERGKVVHDQLVHAIDMLKPNQPRPPEPLPREWYNYVVLYDAYVKDVPNREIMARMYVSEGTFNRSRRNALRGVARYLLEQNKRN